MRLPQIPLAARCAVLFLALSASVAHSQSSSQTDLFGVWSGIDVGGGVVTHVFEPDGSASIHRNGEPQLEGDESKTVTWSVAWREDGLGDLDIVIAMNEGDAPDTTVRFLAGWTEEGALRIRSAGPSPERPLALAPEDDRLQITFYRD